MNRRQDQLEPTDSAGDILPVSTAPQLASEASEPPLLTRRSILGLAAAALVAASCGSSTAKSGQNSPKQSSTTVTGAGGATPVTQIGGPHVAEGSAVSTTDAQRLATESNGHWQGGWHDSTGANGDTDVTINIDPTSRTVRTTMAVGGNLLGTPLAPETYEIDLLSFMINADHYDISSPQLGQVNIVPGGVGSASATAQSVPGHPEIATVSINGTRLAQRADVHYTIKYVDGHSVTGTMAWSRSGPPATPSALPVAGGPPNPVDIQSGVYAASLITSSDLTSIFKTSIPAPGPNGGRLYYSNGIDTSNASVTADDYFIAYTVYVGADAATTSAFWAQQGSGQTVAGPWKAAFWLIENSSLYVYATATRVLKVNVLRATATPPPGANQPGTPEQLATAVAVKLVAALSSP